MSSHRSKTLHVGVEAELKELKGTEKAQKQIEHLADGLGDKIGKEMAQASKKGGDELKKAGEQIGEKIVDSVANSMKKLSTFEKLQKVGKNIAQKYGKEFTTLERLAKKTEQLSTKEAMVGAMATRGRNARTFSGPNASEQAAAWEKQVVDMIDTINNGLSNSKQNYFVEQTQAIDRMFESFTKLQKAREKGNATQEAKFAKDLTRWANAYQGIHGGQVSKENAVLSSRFGSKEDFSQALKVIRQVNGGKSKYGAISSDYSADAFKELTAALREATDTFKMDMKYLVSEKLLQELGLTKDASGKPTPAKAMPAKRSSEAKDFNGNKQSRWGSKVSKEASQYRVDQIEQILDKVWKQYVEDGEKSMDKAIEKVRGRDRINGQTAQYDTLDLFEEHLRLTGDRDRYRNTNGEQGFRTITAESNMAKKQLQTKWEREHFKKTYGQALNKNYEEFLKKQGKYKVDLPKEDKAFSIPGQLDKVEGAVKERLSYLQNFLDGIAKQVNAKEGGSLEDYIRGLGNEDFKQLQEMYGEYIAGGGDKYRYRTLNGQLPFHQLAGGRVDYWKRHIKTNSYQQEVYGRQQKRKQQSLRNGALNLNAGQTFKKTSNLTQEEEEAFMADLARKELEQIAKNVPEGQTTKEQRRNELSKRLQAVFQSAIQSHKQGNRFSVSGGYGVGNDAQLRSDFYEFLSLGGEPTDFEYKGFNPFTFNQLNAAFNGQTTEQVKEFWKKIYHSRKQDDVLAQQKLLAEYQKEYSRRGAAIGTTPPSEAGVMPASQVETYEQYQKQLEEQARKLKQIKSRQQENDRLLSDVRNRILKAEGIDPTSEKAIYDQKKLSDAKQRMSKFDTTIASRKDFTDKYNSLIGMIQDNFLGEFGIFNGEYSDIEAFANSNPQMKTLLEYAKNGVPKGTRNSKLTGLFNGVMNSLRGHVSSVQSVIGQAQSGWDISGKIEQETNKLSQEGQKLQEEYDKQADAVVKAREKWLDSLAKTGSGAQSESSQAMEQETEKLRQNTQAQEENANARQHNADSSASTNGNAAEQAQETAQALEHEAEAQQKVNEAQSRGSTPPESPVAQQAQRAAQSLQHEAQSQQRVNEAKEKGATDDVVYHAGTLSRLNKADTLGKQTPDRGTGYFGTGHYFVDNNLKNSVAGIGPGSGYYDKPFTSVDISYYKDLFKVKSDEEGRKLHSFLKDITKYAFGSDEQDIGQLYSTFQQLFKKEQTDQIAFQNILNGLRDYASTRTGLEDRRDSVSTKFMKQQGYQGVDTRGTNYANTQYGVVIYDLKEQSILQANITDELQKQGDMIERIQYAQGEAWDKGEDERIQKLLQQQQIRREIQQEFNKLYDRSNYDQLNREYENTINRLGEIDNALRIYRDQAENPEKAARSMLEEMGRMGLMDEDEINGMLHEETERMRQSAQENIIELQQEREQLEKNIGTIKEKMQIQEKSIAQSMQQAKRNVQERHNPDQGARSAQESIESAGKVAGAYKEAAEAARQLSEEERNVAEAAKWVNESNNIKELQSQIAAQEQAQRKMQEIAERAKQMRQEFMSLLKDPNIVNAMKFNDMFDNILGFNGASNKQINATMADLKQVSSLFDVITNMGQKQGDNIMSFKGNGASAFANLQQAQSILSQIGYTFGEIKDTGKSLQAQIVPIPDQAITNADELLSKLLEIKTVENQIKETPPAGVKSDNNRPSGGGTPPTGGTGKGGSSSGSGGGTPTASTQQEDQDDWTNAVLTRNQAISAYTKNYRQYIELLARGIALQGKGSHLDYGEQQRLLYLQELINKTRDYIDVEEGRLLQTERNKDGIITHNEQVKQNNVAYTKEMAEQEVGNIQAVFERMSEAMQNSDTSMGEYWNRFQTLISSGLQGLDTEKISQLTDKIIRLNEAFITGKDTNADYQKKMNALLRPYQEASAVMRGVAPGDVEKTIRQNLLVSARARGYKVQQGDINISGGKNKKGTLKVTDRKGQVQILSQQFDAQSEALGRLQSAYTTGQSASEKFFSSLKSHAMHLTTYAATFLSFYRVIGVFKKAISQITAFDTALTEMRKVSDESIDRLKNFQEQSFNMAEQIGSTAQQIQESTADFLRLGQDFQTAKESAKNANILFNVSEFQNIDDATTSLIAMSQAYKDLDQTHIIDALNKVGNDFSISTSGLAEGLQRSASALTTSGNSLEESIGLITAANQVVQNPQNVGAAMKIISLRLAGQKQQIEDMGEDTEGMVTTVSKLKAGIMNATKTASNGMKGVNIEDTNGNLRNTYSILQEIADIWQEIGQQDKLNGTNQQNYLLETMAGKNRSNVLASLLQSPDVLRNAYEQALDSQGSAMIENQKFLESIEGHMNSIKNQASEFAFNMLSSDGIKGIIDLGTQLLKILNQLSKAFGGLSTLGVIGGGIGTFRNLKNVYNDAVGAAAISKQVTGLQDAARSFVDGKALAQLVKNNIQFGGMSTQQLQSIVADPGITAAVRNAYNLQMGLSSIADAAQGAAKPVVKFGDVLHTAFSGANLIPTVATLATLFISLGTAAYNAYQRWKKARIENAAELAGQYKDTSKDIDTQIQNYKKASESLQKSNITEQQAAKVKSELLGIQNQLSESYGKQVQGIDLVNGKLDEQIEKLQTIKKEKAKDYLSEAGAQGESQGDFEYAYKAMTQKNDYMTYIGNVPQIVEWAQQYKDKGLSVEQDVTDMRIEMLDMSRKEALQLFEQMGDDLENIADVDLIKETDAYKTLANWINSNTKDISKTVKENEDAFKQYLNMKLITDESHGISYSYKGQDYENASLGGFYYRYQQAADEYSKALSGSDDEAIEEAREVYTKMRDAWTSKLDQMHEANSNALDDYQYIMADIPESINQQAEKSYDLAKNYKSQDVTDFRKRANLITNLKISKEQFEGAAKGKGIQKYEPFVQGVLQEALSAGFLTDVEDEGQIDWLIKSMDQLGIFSESASKSAKKAQGNFASFLNTAANPQDNKTFSDLIDNIQSTSSSLDDWDNKFQKGAVDRAGLTDLFQEFPDLASDAQFLQTVTDNMNAEGFVKYSSDIKRALADVNYKSVVGDIQKINEELSDPDSYTPTARRNLRKQRDLLIDSIDFSGVSTGEMLDQIYGAKYNEKDKGRIRNFLTGELSKQNGAEVVARLLLDDQAATWSYDEWKSQVEAEYVEVELRPNVKEFKKSIEDTKSMMDKNAKITSFEESLDSGKAKAQDLLSLISQYPTEFEAISDTVSKVLSGENIDGTIDGAKELSGVLAHIRVDNLEDSLANAENDIQRIIAYSQADLSGISKEDATRLISQDERGYNIAGKTKEDLLDIAQTGDAVKRQAAVLALGMQISFTDAMEIVQNQLEQTEVSAIKTFDSMSDSIDSFKEKVASDTATPDDVLGLVETFPELLEYTDVLGHAFSNLSMSGALSDASQLEQILTQIQQKKLAEYLKENKIKDQDIVQGMARQIDFSSISKEDADEYVKRIKNQYGLDLSQYDTSTAEGRDIIGHINFVVENAQVTNLKSLVDDSVSQGASDGLKKSMSDIKALDSASSSLNDYMNKALSGELTASDLDSLYESFGDLITDGSQLDALYSSLNMEGFVSDAETAVALINDLKIAKLQKFIGDQKEAGTLTKEAQRNMVNQTRLTGATEDEARAAAQILSTNKNVDMGQIQKLYEQGKYSAIIRLSLYPEIQNADEFQSDLDAAVEAYSQDVQESIKVGVDIVSNIGSSNASIDDFTDKLKENEATSDDLLSLLKDAPKAAEEAGAELSKMLDNPNADGTLKNIEGVNEALAHLKYENIEKGVDEVARLNDLSQDAQALLRKSAFSTADLSGISATDADEIVSKYADSDQKLHDMANSANQLEREAAAVAAGMGVSFEQAFSIVETRAEKAKISAVQSFKSMGDEIAQFSEKAANNEVTSDDVLGLIETFPELLGQTDVLSDAFSQLSLDGVVSDASTLQALLESISQMRLKDLLDSNGITDPDVIMGLANNLDFSHTDRVKAGITLNHLKEAGIDVSGIDINTEEGLDILGHIQFVIENSEGEKVQEVVDNAVSNGAKKGIQKTISQASNLSKDMSTLSGMSESITSGTFTIEDVASLEQSFADLNISGEQLNAIYSSINMEGFVEDAESANALINQLKLSKLTEFYKNNPSITNASKQALLNATRLTGIGATEGQDAYKKLKARKDVDQRKIQDIYEAGNYDALVRLQLRLLYNGQEDFDAAVQGALDASAEDKKLEFTQNLDVLTNLADKNTGVSSFVDQVASGEATVDGLLSLLGDVPQIALYSGDALAQMIDSADFDGTITSIEGLSKAAQSFTLKNIEDQFKQIEQLTDNENLQNALKGYLVDQADLSGATERDINNALKETSLSEDVRKQILANFRKGEFSAEAIMKVFLRGDIDDSDVMAELENEQAKISRKRLSASVQAEINLHSDYSSLNDLSASLANNEATPDDILNLMNSMPEFLSEVEALGISIADMDSDGLVDNAESIQTAINKTKLTNLEKFLSNKNVSNSQKMSNIINTSLDNINAADRQIHNSALYDLLQGKNYTAGAAFKADLMIDNGLIGDDTRTIQAVLDSLDTNVQINTEVKNLQKTIAGLQTLDTAISEFNDTGTVSAETVKALEQAGIGYNEVLFESESGIKVNTEAATALHDSMAATGIAMSRMITEKSISAMRQNRDRMNEIIDTYNEAHDQTLSLQDVLSDAATYGEQFSEVFQLNEANQSIAQATNNLQNMEAELRNSIDLFTKFQEAQSSANPSDNYNTVTGAMQTAKKLWDQGWVGKDDFKTFAQLIAPQGTDVQQAVRDFEANYEHVKGYLTEDTSGLWKFLDDAKAKGFFKDTDDGMEMMIDNLDDFAKEMGISTSLAEQFFFAMKDMNFDVDFSSLTDSYRQQINQLSGNMDQSNAGQQIQNAIDKFFTFSQAGEDVRESLDPLVAAMNEFKRLHPEQDIQPWIDSLNSLGLLNGFTISVNEDGSLSVVTAELQQTASLIQEIQSQDPSVEVQAEVHDEQVKKFEELLSTDEGRQALIKCNFQIDENTTGEDLISQITNQDPNHPIQIPAEIKLINTPEQALPEDTNTATHEMRKGMANLTPESTVTEPEPIVTEFKLNTDPAKREVQKFRSDVQSKPIEMTAKVKTPSSSAASTPAPKDTNTATHEQRKAIQSSSATLDIDADTGGVDKAQKKVNKLNSTKIEDKKFNVSSPGLSVTLSQMRQLSRLELHDQDFTVTPNGLATAVVQLRNAKSYLDGLHDKNVNINMHVSKSTGGGTVGVLGTAHATGTARVGGRDFTVGRNETALVNEVGQESRVHNGKWELLPGGPHMQKFSKDDIIFNAEQTADLIKSGKTARQGKPVTPSAYARGTARDLVGEEGVEMYVDPRRGKWQTVGEVGPEFIDLPKDAVVFDHDQTTDLLNKGYTNTRATLAHVDGTLDDVDLSDEDFIYNSFGESEYGDAFLTGNAYDKTAQNVGVTLTDKGGSKFTKKVGSSSGDDTKSKNANTDATKKNTKATKDNTKKKKEEGQVFDWIASRLSYLADQTSKFADAITDFVSYSDKMANLVGKIDQFGKTINATDSYGRSRQGQLASILQEIAETRQGSNRYWEEAKNVKAPYSSKEIATQKKKGKKGKAKAKQMESANAKFEETKKMIDAGYVINIETIKDSNLATAISNYQQYADSARQAENNVENLQRSLIELYSTWAKAPAEEAEKQIERLTKGLQGLEAAQARLDAISKGGSTQSILDRLLGKGNGKGSQYSNLGGAGFAAFAQDNASKTAYYKKAWEESTRALQRTRSNRSDYINYETNRLNNETYENTPATTTKKSTVSKKSVKSTGKSIAKKYKGKLTKKQRNALRSGKKVSLGKTKGKLRTKLKNYNSKVKASNTYTTYTTPTSDTQTYKTTITGSRTGVLTDKEIQSSGKSIASKYSKSLTPKQERALAAGKKVNVKKVKGKKAKAAVKKQNALVTAHKKQKTAKSSGKKIADKYSKSLTKKQIEDLKAGKSIKLTKKQKKNKSLVKAVTKHNKNAKSATKATKATLVKTNTTSVSAKSPKSEVAGEKAQGEQIFNDAVAEAQADAVAKAAEYAAQKVQEIRDNFDYLTEAYETQLKYQEAMNKWNERDIEDAETFGDLITAANRDQQENNLAINKQLKEQEAMNLQKILDAGVENGTIQKGSKEWLEMTEQIYAAKSAAHDYAVQIKQTEIKKLEDIVNHYGKIVDFMESILDLSNAMKGYDFDDAVGNYKKISYYEDNISAKQEIANQKWDEASQEQMAFWKMAGKKGSGAAYEEGTDSYIQKQAEINKLWKEAYDARADVAKLNAEKIQLQIEQWTRQIDRQDKFIDNLNTIAGLMNDAAKWNYDTGDLTEQGQMSMVIDKESYVNAINDLQEISKERDELQKKFRENANYGQQKYDEDLEELVSRQMSALGSAKSALESFTKTVETTAQKQLEALNKVINKRKEALQKQKEMHDYDRQLKNSNKEIALLEAQSRALEGVADAESKAMKARIDAQIQQKREALQDTTRDHAVSLQTEGLSDLQEKMQENFQRWSHEFEANSAKQLAVMNSTNMSASQLTNQMNVLLSTYGVDMSQLKITTGQMSTNMNGLNTKFNAFIADNTAYTLAVKSNADLQTKMVASWQGPISQALATKLSEELAKITSAGEQSIINALGVTDGRLVDNGTNLIKQVSDRIGTTDSGLTKSVQNVAAGIAAQAKITQDDTIPTITDKIDEVIDAINGKSTPTPTSTGGGGNNKSSSTPTTSSKTTTKIEIGANGQKYEVTRDSKGKMISARLVTGSSTKFVTGISSVFTGKARGSLSINKDDRYLTQEKGGEIITTKDGVLIPLKAGDGVVPAQLTEKLFEMARNYPDLPSASNVQIPNIPASGTRTNLTVSYGSLLTVNGNVTEDLLPDLKTILQESYKYTERQLAMDARKAGLRRGHY